MENHKLIEKLMEKTNIQYEEAKITLEKNNYNILDAILDLEIGGKVKGPEVSVYYTNKFISSNEEILAFPNANSSRDYNKEDVSGTGAYSRKNFFQVIGDFIERCNNIFVEISKGEKTYIRFPVTVVALLLFFCFWTVIVSIIISVFFDIEFSVSGEGIDGSKNTINNFSSNLSKKAREVRRDIKTKHKKE